MAPVAYLVAGSLGSALLAIAVFGPSVGREIVLGMLGPLLAVTATWVAVARAHRRDPAGVTAVMIRAFVAKMIFFGAYAVAVVGVLEVRPLAFLASFTCYFLSLYGVEAVLLHRLSARALDRTGASASR